MKRFEKEHIWGGADIRRQDHYFNKENPWDGSDKMIRTPKAKSMDMTNLLRPLIILAAILSLFALLFAGTSNAGRVVEKESKASSESKSDKKSSGINYKDKAPRDRDAAEIAEEYAFLLEQLLYLSTDYFRYFEEVDDKAAAENYKALAQMCSRISEGEQYENFAKILVEIGKLREELSGREKELEKIQEELQEVSADLRTSKANRRALRLTTTLREELESLDEQIERDVVWRIENNSYDKDAIQKYVRALVDDSLIRYVGAMAEAYSGTHVYVHPNKNGVPEAVAVPDAPEVTIVYTEGSPTPDYVVSPPTPDSPPDKLFSHSFTFREFRDSLQVKSADIDISITNVVGNVVVTNSPSNYVFTTYNVSVTSDNEESSKKLSDEVFLRITPKANKIYIESIAPKLNNPSTRIAESQLKVLVPKNNYVSVNNSSGNVTVTDLRNGVDVKSSLGNIEILRIDGNVALVNSSGTVNVGKVDGNVNLQNKTGPITLFRCNGAIEVDNSFGQITMENCKGKAVIRNTGPIEVDNHIGAIEITNRNGLISIENVEGNISVFNSFETIAVSNIQGTAKIVNANALVSLQDVSGLTTVNNRFGNISGMNLTGPLEIENKSGNITLSFSKLFSGNSNIVSNGGNIIMSVPSTSNLSIDLESLGGSIQVAGFDSAVNSTNAGVKRTELKLGSGAGKLAVKGTGSNIILDRSQ